MGKRHTIDELEKMISPTEGGCTVEMLPNGEIRKREVCQECLQVENDLKPFPMQDGPPITWKTAKAVYRLYAQLYSNDQSLEKIAERGGFGWGEVGHIWKECCRRGVK